MNKNTLWYLFVLLLAYFMLVFLVVSSNAETLQSPATRNMDNTYQRKNMLAVEEGRRRPGGYGGLYKHAWGLPALAIAYWIKVKVVIVSFFIGSAIFVGLRYFWPHKCHSEIVKEGPIIYDHPPSFSSYHDHGPSFDSSPYSFSHHDSSPYSFNHHESGPYSDSGPPSSLSSSFFDHAGSSSSPGTGFSLGSISPFAGYPAALGSGTVPSTAPDTLTTLGDTDSLKRKRRSPVKKRQAQQPMEPNPHRPILPTEQQIGEMMFYFLGLDTPACRRRFICEMEFRARLHPLTSMAFRMVGRTFFEKYRNEHNVEGRAGSFGECAAVNAECVFIENEDEAPIMAETEEEPSQAGSAAMPTVDQSKPHEDPNNSAENAVEVVTNDNPDQHHTSEEQQNAVNLQAERRSPWKTLRRRQSAGRQFAALAERLFASQLNEQ